MAVLFLCARLRRVSCCFSVLHFKTACVLFFGPVGDGAEIVYVVWLASSVFQLQMTRLFALAGWPGMMQLRQIVVASIFLVGVRGSAWSVPRHHPLLLSFVCFMQARAV